MLRFVASGKSARRPPELLTRDHVARCINREIKAGRGSPHGGVYLDNGRREYYGSRVVASDDRLIVIETVDHTVAYVKA